MNKKFFVLFLLIFFVQCGGEKKVSEKIIQIEYLQGKVFVSSDGVKWQNLSKNTIIQVGDWVKTGEKSKLKIRIAGFALCFLDENTVLKIEEIQEKQKTKTFLQQGAVFHKINKNANQSYQINGPAMVAGVRGTSFTFQTDGKKDTVWVKQGKVSVKRNITNAPEKVMIENQIAEVTVAENKKLEGKDPQKMEIIVKTKETKETKKEEKNSDKKTGFRFFEPDYE